MTKTDKILINYTELKLVTALGLVLVFFLLFALAREAVATPTPATVIKATPFDDVEIIGKAAYVYDVRNKTVLYQKNATLRLPLASLTKVMSAVVADELSHTGQMITITPEALQAEGDSGLRVGELWTLRDLLDISLVSSSNDGIRAVALAIGAGLGGDPVASFVEKMNLKTQELHLKDTYYFNETGLDESDVRGGAYGSAKDQALLFVYLLDKHPELLSATVNDRVEVILANRKHAARNTDRIVDAIPGLRASKTGFTDIAGGNLVIAFDPEIGRPIVVSVLGSTEEGRFQDVATLVEKALQAIQSTP